MPPATLVDIARQTKTSVSTVSRVLAGGAAADRISAQTRGRVLRVAQEMGYRPNLLARSLRTRKTQTIALLVSDIANPIFSHAASQIEQLLRRHGYSLLLCNSGEDPNLEDEYLNLLPRKGIDGFIIVPVMRGKRELMEALPEKMPLVVLDRPIPGISASCSLDEEQSTQALCDTLKRVGVKRILLVCGPRSIYTHRRRAELISDQFEVMARHEGPAQIDTGRQAFVQTLEYRPDAVLCTNNFLGMGYIESIESIESPPIIGTFDEIPLMHLLPLPIASAVQDVPLLAEGSVRLLMSQLTEDKTPLEPILIPGRIVTNRAFQHRQSAQ